MKKLKTQKKGNHKKKKFMKKKKNHKSTYIAKKEEIKPDCRKKRIYKILTYINCYF